MASAASSRLAVIFIANCAALRPARGFTLPAGALRHASARTPQTCMRLGRADMLARGRTSARVRAASSGGGGASIVQRVNDELKAAMRAKETTTLTSLRNVKAALLVAMKEEGADDLADAKAVLIMRKLAKMRQESIDMFAKAPGGGADRIAEEAAELALIERFLPRLADEAQTRAWVGEAIAASPGADAGRVMGALMKAHREDIDGKLAQRLVKEMLG